MVIRRTYPRDIAEDIGAYAASQALIRTPDYRQFLLTFRVIDRYLLFHGFANNTSYLPLQPTVESPVPGLLTRTGLP